MLSGFCPCRTYIGTFLDAGRSEEYILYCYPRTSRVAVGSHVGMLRTTSAVFAKQPTASLRVFQTHHLKAPQKKKRIRHVCSQSGVSALVKVGVPGVLFLFAKGTGRDEVSDLGKVCGSIGAQRWASEDWRPREPLSTLNFDALYGILYDRTTPEEHRELAQPDRPRIVMIETMSEMSQVFKDASERAGPQETPSWVDIWQKHMKPSAPGQAVPSSERKSRSRETSQRAATSNRKQRKVERWTDKDEAQAGVRRRK